MRLRGRRIRAANLAPLAVDPGYMGRGLGGALMKASHETLAAAGISLAFLCGHEGYYPRFGYRGGMFGNVAVKPKAHGGSSDARQRLRAPHPDDEAALRRLWEECHGEVDLALEPDPGFFPWMAWTPATQAGVLEGRDGEVVGYARFTNARPSGPFDGPVEAQATLLRLFLAADAVSAADLLSALGVGQGADTSDSAKPLLVPLHPDSRAALRLFPCGFSALSERGGYAMALPLDGGPDADQAAAAAYCEGVAMGRLEPGLLLLPPVFDLE